MGGVIYFFFWGTPMYPCGHGLRSIFFLIQSSTALPGFTWAHLPKSTALCLFNNP